MVQPFGVMQWVSVSLRHITPKSISRTEKRAPLSARHGGMRGKARHIHNLVDARLHGYNLRRM
jgi:hypothetical protein